MSGTLGIPENVAYATAAIYAVLILASLIVVFLRFRNPGERYQELADRTESWWWMIGAFTACVLFNQTVAVIFVAFISYLALKEYLSLIPTRRIDRAILLSPISPSRSNSIGLRPTGTACSSCSCRFGCSCSSRR
jgi:phosphatidate cytidylyltransferase